MQDSDFRTISISTGTFVRLGLVALLFAFFYVIRDLVVVVLTAVVIASAIEPLTLWFQKRHVARIISVLGTYLVFGAGFIGVFYFFVPSLLSDTSNFLNSVPKYLEAAPSGLQLQTDSIKQKAEFAQNLSKGFAQGSTVAQEISRPSSFTAVFTDLGQILSSFSEGFWDNIGVFFGGIISFILIVVLSFYLAVQEDGEANLDRKSTRLNS